MASNTNTANVSCAVLTCMGALYAACFVLKVILAGAAASAAAVTSASKRVRLRLKNPNQTSSTPLPVRPQKLEDTELMDAINLSAVKFGEFQHFMRARAAVVVVVVVPWLSLASSLLRKLQRVCERTHKPTLEAANG